MKKITFGILAHVDAGKTTLSENILYCCRVINSPGRVDNRNTFLDTDEIERDRGITVYSKEARFTYGDCLFTLIDTPGHADFYKDLERNLYALDMAVIVISATEGVQPHTKFLYEACKRLSIPVWFFVNKTDLAEASKDEITANIKNELGNAELLEMTGDIYERVALVSEDYLERFFGGELGDSHVATAIKEGLVNPLLFGSALKGEGVEELLSFMALYALPNPLIPASSIVIRIGRSKTLERLTFVKVQKGSIRIREDYLGEKVTAIRQYNGDTFVNVESLEEGDLGCILGPVNTMAGQCVIDGDVSAFGESYTVPVIRVAVKSPTLDDILLVRYLEEYRQEEPSLLVSKGDNNREILIDVMGKMYLEVLKRKFKSRYGADLAFSKVKVLYKETIRGEAAGLGHFEPLRHYAHVELLLKEAAPGSGINVISEVSEDIIDKASQANIINSLKRYRHRGILTGALLTDVTMVLTYAKDHKKHTVGADFYEAGKRAVRCALNFAENVLLEPYYEYEIKVPINHLNRLTFDLSGMNATSEVAVYNDEAVVKGKAPVVCMSDYLDEMKIYTAGKGELYLFGVTYEECHNTDEVVAETGYMQSFDTNNTSDSVICEGGASKIIDYMTAIDRYGFFNKEKTEETVRLVKSTFIGSIGTDEIDEIMAKSGGLNTGKSNTRLKKKAADEYVSAPKRVYKAKEKFFLVDGYNIIHAFKDLEDLSKASFDAARGALLDMMCNYAGAVGVKLMVVFDAYKVSGGVEKRFDYNNIIVVYTREAQTADQYIERFTKENSKDYDITVATSDRLEQVVVRGFSGRVMSAPEFEREIENSIPHTD